ncbi:hypothetical protein APA_4054 [Pseudanabaena sp. lw0831]|nr:hypothetical protein APA_4054 [Pseudanabaena sp. lw0831]
MHIKQERRLGDFYRITYQAVVCSRVDNALPANFCNLQYLCLMGDRLKYNSKKL